MPAVFQRTNQLVEKTLGICVKKRRMGHASTIIMQSILIRYHQ